MCRALVPPSRTLGKFWFPSFFPHPKLEKLVPLLLYSKFRRLFLKFYCPLCKYHCKNTFYYHLSLVCTIYVQRGWNFCCRKQIFKEIYANLSLKVPIFAFFIPILILKSWIPPLFEKSPPFLVSPTPIFFRFPHPFLKFSKFGFPPLERGGDTL